MGSGGKSIHGIWKKKITEKNSGKISIFIVNVVISISMQSARF